MKCIFLIYNLFVGVKSWENVRTLKDIFFPVSGDIWIKSNFSKKYVGRGQCCTILYALGIIGSELQK